MAGPATHATNGARKMVENVAAAVSLHFMHYNFCRVHECGSYEPRHTAGDSTWPGTDAPPKHSPNRASVAFMLVPLSTEEEAAR